MAAGRFRAPKVHTPAQRRQPRPGWGRKAGFRTSANVQAFCEREPDPVLRVPRTGIRNMPRKQQAALRKERKADPAGAGVHPWRRRQW